MIVVLELRDEDAVETVETLAQWLVEGKVTTLHAPPPRQGGWYAGDDWPKIMRGGSHQREAVEP